MSEAASLAGGRFLPFNALRRTCFDVIAAVEQGPGLVVLAGPIGAGKTTALQHVAKASVSSGRALLRTAGQPRPDDVKLDLVDNLDEAGLALLLADPLRTGRQVAAARPDLVSVIQQAVPQARFVHVRPLEASDVRLLLEARRTQAKLPQHAFTLRSQAALERLCGGNPARLELLAAHAMANAQADKSGRISASHVEKAAEMLSSTRPALFQGAALETQTSPKLSCKVAIFHPLVSVASNVEQTVELTSFSVSQSAGANSEKANPFSAVKTPEAAPHAAAHALEHVEARSCAEPVSVSGPAAAAPGGNAFTHLPTAQTSEVALRPVIADDLDVVTMALLHPVSPIKPVPTELSESTGKQTVDASLRAWDLLNRPLTPAERTRLQRREWRRRSARIAACILPVAAVASYCVLHTPVADVQGLIAAGRTWLDRVATSTDKPSRPPVAQFAGLNQPSSTTGPMQELSRPALAAPPTSFAAAAPVSGSPALASPDPTRADAPQPANDDTAKVVSTEPAAIAPLALPPALSPTLATPDRSHLPEPAKAEASKTEVTVSVPVPEPVRPAPSPAGIDPSPVPPVSPTPTPPAIALAPGGEPTTQTAQQVGDPAKAARLLKIGQVLLSIGQIEDGREMVQAAARLGSQQAQAVLAGLAPRPARRSADAG